MWECNKCREQSEETFDVCWSCGTTRDGVEDPDFKLEDEILPGNEEPSTVFQSPTLSPDPPPRASKRESQSECPKCGARKMIPALRILDRDGQYRDKSLSVRLDRNPEGLIFKGREVVEMKANACGECGYVEFYITNPRILWSAYEEQEDV